MINTLELVRGVEYPMSRHSIPCYTYELSISTELAVFSICRCPFVIEVVKKLRVVQFRDKTHIMDTVTDYVLFG